MIQHKNGVGLYAKILYSVTALNLIIYLTLFFLTKIKIKPFTHFLLISIIIFLTINIIAYFFKKDIVFIRFVIKHDGIGIGNKFVRFLSLIFHCILYFLINIFIFDNKVFYKTISIFSDEKNALGGGFYFLAISCLLGTILYWLFYFYKKNLADSKYKE